MAKPTWIRAEDGDWYRATEVVAVKTLPYAHGGYMVTIETHRHDNIDVTGRLDPMETAGRCRDALARLLVQVDEGSVITYRDAGFEVESAGA